MTKQDAPTTTDALRAEFIKLTMREGYPVASDYWSAYQAGASSQAARASSAAAQPGWKLVPMESTPEMDEAGFNHVYPPTNHNDCAYVWEAMVKAAPPAPPAKPADTGEASNG